MGENLFLGILYIKLLELLLGTLLSFPVFSIKFYVILVSKEEGQAHGIVAISLCSSCMSAKCLSFFSFKLSTFITPSEILTQKAVWKDSFY